MAGTDRRTTPISLSHGAPRRDHDQRLRTLLVACGLALAGAGLLAGCDADDDTTRALDDAAIKLQWRSPVSGAPASPGAGDVVAEQVVRDLTPVAERSEGGEKAAAWLMISGAQLGLAQTPALEAVRHHANALNLATEINAALAQWLSHNALASALSSYDPAPELAEIDAGIAEKDAEIAAERDAKRAVESSIADLRSEGAAKLDRAQAEREAETELRRTTVNLSATETLGVLQQAKDRSRAADALDVQSSELEARADQIAPQVAEMELLVSKLERQRDLLNVARAEVQARAKLADEQAAGALAHAEQAAADIDRLTSELTAMRADALAPAVEAAVNGFSQAASSAARAGADARTSAQLAVGKARQSAGDAYRSQAHGLASYASLLDALANAAPPLPEQEKYAAAAQAASEARSEVLTKATEAYKAAKTAFESAGASGESKDRLDRVSASLAQVIFETSGGTEDLRAELAATGSPEDGTPEVAGGDEALPAGDGPEATLDRFLSAIRAGQYAAAGDFFLTDSPEEKRAFIVALTFAGKINELDAACRDAFSTGLFDGSAAGLQAIPGLDQAKAQMDRLRNAKASDYQITVTDDSATALDPSAPGEPVTLKLIDGRWLMVNEEVQGAQAAAMVPMMTAMSAAIDGLIAEVRSGQLDSVDAVLAALPVRIQEAMMRAGGGG